MNCMKCGKETEENQIFCPECLAVMDRYPVKPGTVVQIPKQPPKKQPHHRRPVLTQEEQLKRMNRRVHILTLIVILTTAITIFFALMAFDILERWNMQKFLGKNYSVVSQTEEATESTEVTESFGFFSGDWLD